MYFRHKTSAYCKGRNTLQIINMERRSRDGAVDTVLFRLLQFQKA